jgi:hypothetical protein
MASSIDYSVSESVAIVVDEILSRIDSIKNPAFDVREQILGRLSYTGQERSLDDLTSRRRCPAPDLSRSMARLH